MQKYTLDITKDYCPMTLVKTRLKLNTLKKGDQLELRLNKGEPLDNIPKAMEEMGYKVLNIQKEFDDIYNVLFEK
jgi:tRNA 2-thiouridine synthesizing protein A